MEVNRETYQSFLNSVLEKVPEDRRATVASAFADEAVAPVLRDSVLARADYSRQTQAFNQEVAEARANIAEWQKWYDNEVQLAADRDQRLSTYESLYGELDESGQPITEQPAHRTGEPTVDLKQLDQRYLTADDLAKRDNLAMQFADILTDLKLDHKDRFGEKLDSTALMDLAQRSQVSIKEAYRQLTAPLEQARSEKTMAEAIAKAKEEGRREALTDHKLPTTTMRREPHYVDQTTRVTDPRQRVSNAVAAFNAGIAAR